MSPRVASAIAIAVALSLIAAVSAGAAPAKKSTYTVTLNGDRSGPFAAAGTADQNGFQTYIAYVNAHGGVNGHHVKVVALDDHADVPTGLANYQQTLASSSLAFLDVTSSAVFTAVANNAQKDGIVVTSLNSYNGGVGTYPYVYTSGPSVPTFINQVVSFAATQGGPKKAALIAYDSPLTETYSPPMKAALQAKGFQLVYDQRVPVTTTDMSLAAGNIAAQSPGIVITALQDGGQMISLAQGLRQHGYTGPIINFNSNVTAATMQKINDPKMYLVQFTADPNDTHNPAVAAMLINAVKYGHVQGDNLYFFASGYSLAKVITMALARCGNNCTRKLFNWQLQHTLTRQKGVEAGVIGFSRTSHVMVRDLVVDTWNSATNSLQPIKGFGF